MTAKGLLKLLFILAIPVGTWVAWPWRAIRQEPGVLVPMAPLQKEIPPKELPDIEGWHLTAVAEYKLKARVLGTKSYRSGFGSELVPVDVSVAWGRMSDQSIIDQFDISMGNRFLFYECSEALPLPEAEMISHAANNHVISANAQVRSALRWLRSGQIVTMRGYLVNAAGPGGAKWNSSLRRDDTGNGACELFYVESIHAVNNLSEEMDSQTAAR
jgi:hypothetical protein